MKDSLIQWTDHTFNPWEGCTKVALECKHCYAETLVDYRFGRAKWGKGQPRRRTSEALWKQPVRWNREAELKFQAWEAFKQSQGATDAVLIEHGHIPPTRPRVFCPSLGDWLDEEVPIEWLAHLLFLIRRTRNLDWLLLTKRPGNWVKRITDVSAMASPQTREWLIAWGNGESPANVWIGVSAGADQKTALEIPAKIHFLSCEPMLHPLDEEQNHLTQEFDWIIFGGESGKNARPCNIDWIQRGVEMCRFYGIAPFVKQLGRRPYTENANLHDWPNDGVILECSAVATGAAGGDLILTDSHGGDMSEWPEDLRVRQFPQQLKVAVV